MFNKVAFNFLAINGFNTTQPYLVSSRAFDNSVELGNNTYARVFCRFMLHSCSNERCFRNKKRNCLTLHVGTHERTVRVIVLQERNKSRRNRNYLFRRYVHVVNTITRHSQDVIGLFVITNDNILIFKRAVLI
ncbi:hypothetical protein D1872_240340 [compost metagenome]